MTKQNISKRQYIIAAHQIVAAEGLAALTIRRLGRELRCNTANLYRYFDSLEELTMYSALAYLRDYLYDVGALLERESDCIERYFGVWNCFTQHAFANAAVFDLLFFGKYSNKLYLIMQEYYSIFPDEVAVLGAMKTVFVQDFDFRDYLLLDDCVKHGRIEENDAVMLNRVSINLFKGYFKKVLDLNAGPAEQTAEREKFLAVMHFVFDRFIHAAPAQG